MPKKVETPSQYVQRILSNIEGKDPLRVLGATAGRLRAFVRGSPAEMLRRRPAPDKWSAVEIIENHGMHPERGRETVAHLIRLFAGHDLNHLTQIEQIVGQA
jgi:hypothetical protein